MTRRSVVVVGAGIAGLAAAWELSGGATPREESPRVEVIEATDRVGGALATTTFAGRTIDVGADGVLARRPEAIMLVHELDLDDRLVAIGARGASIFLRGALRPLPDGLVLGVPTDPSSVAHYRGLSRRARAALRRDTLLPAALHVGEDLSIGEICRVKLGRDVTYQLVEPLIGGIQAGRVDELSAAAVFPALLEAAREGGSLTRALRARGPSSPGPRHDERDDAPLFQSLSEGVGSLPDALAKALHERGVVIRLGVPVTALRRTPAGDYPLEVDTDDTTTGANEVIVASPAPVAGSLLRSLDSVGDDLRGVEYAGAAIVTFAFETASVVLPAEGTGVLVPLATAWRGEGSLLTTALTFLDRKWPHLGRNDVLVRAHVGRSDDTRWQELSDDALTQRVLSELNFLLGRADEPAATMVRRFPSSLPQYRVGHLALVERARAAAAALGVCLAGNAYDGVGVPACIGSGRRAAHEVLARLT